MNAPDPITREKFAELLALTREPFPASRKAYIPGQLHADLRVPVRDIALTNGEVVSVYDTSGPYTDPDALIDVRKGLASVRGGWITGRGDVEHYEGRAPVALDDGQKSEDATRLAQLRAGGTVVRMEVQQRHKQGHILICLVSARLLDFNGVQMALFSPIDVTRQRAIASGTPTTSSVRRSPPHVFTSTTPGTLRSSSAALRSATFWAWATTLSECSRTWRMSSMAVPLKVRAPFSEG